MNPDEKSNYIDNYQYTHFQESANDVYKTADSKRQCLVQTFVACNSLADESSTCDILSQRLKDYSDLVDDPTGINNYATNVQCLTSNLIKNDCLQWKNELNLNDVSDILKSITCCTNNEVPEDELNVLFEKRTPTILKPNLIQKRPIIPHNSNQFFKNPEIINPSRPKSDECISNVDNFGTNRNKNYQPQSNVKKPNYEDSNQSNKRDNFGVFKTARDELQVQNAKKNGAKNAQNNQQFSYGASKKSLGTRRGVQSKFVPPIRTDSNDCGSSAMSRNDNNDKWEEDEVVDERLKNIDPRMVELIRSEIMDSSAPISWDDIAGLEFAKTIIKEVVVWPLLRPDIFTGLRQPPKGILLFGPPGTGKTLIGKCIASQSQSTFFSISASSLTSKWIGDGEKMVRAMFAVARCHQPAVIFIDEIDSLLSQRSETEHESSRRIKTEFLVQLDGAATGDEDRILVIGATNRPQELDEAARRRFVKRLHIPLPEKPARLEIVKRLMNSERNELTEQDMDEIAELSKGYSGADMKNLCAESSLGPIRSIDISMIQNIQPDQVRAITMQDFRAALNRVRASVSSTDLNQYTVWDRTYGAGGW